MNPFAPTWGNNVAETDFRDIGSQHVDSVQLALNPLACSGIVVVREAGPAAAAANHLLADLGAGRGLVRFLVLVCASFQADGLWRAVDRGGRGCRVGR